MDKKQDILDAALTLFAERGFHGTPVPMIAQKAHVGAGTIYRYFRDKEHLVNELYRHWKIEIHEAISRDLPLDLPLRPLFGEIWRRWVNFILENRDAFTFLSAHHHAPYLDEESRTLGERLHSDITFTFENGIRDQIFKDVDPEVHLAVLSGILVEVMKVYWSGDLELTPELLSEVEEMCWQAIRR